MNYFLYLFYILFLCSFKKIEIATNFTHNPHDQAVIAQYFQGLESFFKKNNIQLIASDLLHNLNSGEISTIVVWNEPIALPGVKPLKNKRIPKEKAILFMWEPPNILPKMYRPANWKNFKKIYTWDDSLVDNKKFFKFYYPVLQPMLKDTPAFSQKKLVAFVFKNGYLEIPDPRDLYPERKKLVEFFEDKKEGEFECYGRGWESLGYKNYKGITQDKIQIIKNFKFTIAYENIKDLPGYISEKIFDAFIAGTVPIYWGASNIEQYIPKNCFIDRREFNSNEELYFFLKNMEEKTYTQYIENIDSFLQSDKAHLFSLENFQKIFLEAVNLKYLLE